MTDKILEVRGLTKTADFKDLIGHFVPASSQTLRAAM